MTPDLARRLNLVSPDPTGVGFSHIQKPVVGGNAYAVRSIDWKHNLSNVRAVCARVEHRAAIALAFVDLARIGEVESALAIEHDVVGSTQRDITTVAVQNLDAAAPEIDGFDPAARVVFSRARPGRVRPPTSRNSKPPLLHT